MPTTTEGSQYLAQRQRMAADVEKLLVSAKSNIALNTVQGDTDANADIDAAIARLKTTAR